MADWLSFYVQHQHMHTRACARRHHIRSHTHTHAHITPSRARITHTHTHTHTHITITHTHTPTSGICASGSGIISGALSSQSSGLTAAVSYNRRWSMATLISLALKR